MVPSRCRLLPPNPKRTTSQTRVSDSALPQALV